jgi:ATP-dependent RNA helicase DHX37/DHR1
MKAMNIDKVVNFPFPSPPDIVQVKSAERRLVLLGALKESEHKGRWFIYGSEVSLHITSFTVPHVSLLQFPPNSIIRSEKSNAN